MLLRSLVVLDYLYSILIVFISGKLISSISFNISRKSYWVCTLYLVSDRFAGKEDHALFRP